MWCEMNLAQHVEELQKLGRLAEGGGGNLDAERAGMSAPPVLSQSADTHVQLSPAQRRARSSRQGRRAAARLSDRRALWTSPGAGGARGRAPRVTTTTPTPSARWSRTWGARRAPTAPTRHRHPPSRTGALAAVRLVGRRPAVRPPCSPQRAKPMGRHPSACYRKQLGRSRYRCFTLPRTYDIARLITGRRLRGPSDARWPGRSSYPTYTGH